MGSPFSQLGDWYKNKLKEDALISPRPLFYFIIATALGFIEEHGHEDETSEDHSILATQTLISAEKKAS